MEYIIFENKEKIISQINECIKNDNLNLLLIGNIPSDFITKIIELYYKKKYNISFDNKYDNMLTLDGHNDINNNIINNITTFKRKVSLKKKIIIIYNFDNLSDYLQNNFKRHITNKIIFILCSKNIDSIYESILTRTTHIFFEEFKKDNKILYINTLIKKYKIYLNDSEIEDILNKNINIFEINKVFKYIKLINIKDYNIKNIIDNLYCIDISKIELYFELIKKKDIKGSINLMFNLYDNGYSVTDIYFFIYEYVKNNLNNDNGYILSIVSYYINKIYDGYDSKLSLVFFTNNIIKGSII